LGIQTLAGIARNSTSDSARVQAVALLLRTAERLQPALSASEGVFGSLDA
jgi:hypothetical protein